MVTYQHGATIVKTIAADRLDALKSLLQSIGNDIEGNSHVPFAQLNTVHFMSWFIVEPENPVPPQLFLEINVDGPVEEFIDELVARAGPGLDLIYGHCIDYPAAGSRASAAFAKYLLASNIGYDCYYIGWRGLGVDRILRERDLRARIETFLDQTGDATLSSMQPAAIRTMIQKFVAGDSTLAWARTVPPRPFLVRYRSQVLLAFKLFGGLAGLAILWLAYALWQQYGPGPDVVGLTVIILLVLGLLGLLRWHEATDSVSTAEPDHGQVQDVVNQENRAVQNHFASVADVKPGLFRWVLLKSVLKLIHLLAAISANQGNLSGITSIHFARWVVIDRGRRLLFLSNYDGSWENYLDDFIDRASNGLTAIWSNTVGFPRSYFLVYGGATDELLFKTLVRQSQRPSWVWYSAYPDLSIQNINANAAIREGLFKPMDAAGEQAWLELF